MTKLRIEPISKPKLVRDATIETIRHAIINGVLPPGSRLIERELCEATGASRASVREAIRQLEADRLVVVMAHKGPAVARLTPTQAAEIYELRADLEVRLARAFCERASESDMDKLGALLQEVVEAASHSDKPALVDIMGRFDEHIMAVSGLEVTSDMLRTLLARISWLRFVAMTQAGRIQRSVQEIRDIVHALRERDPDGADRTIRFYVRNAAEAALQQLKAAQ